MFDSVLMITESPWWLRGFIVWRVDDDAAQYNTAKGNTQMHSKAEVPLNLEEPHDAVLKVDSGFYPSEVSKMSTQLAWGGSMCSLHN